MVTKTQFRRSSLVVVIVAGLLLYLSIKLVCFVHLALLYGFEEVVSGKIYFVSMKPHLLVSNGDKPPAPQSLLNFVACVFTWAASGIVVLPIIQKHLQ
jgi:hypothetical protein